MPKKNELNSFDIFRNIATEFAPCMNDYLYVYDIPNDSYCITEQALERFKIPSCIFHDVTATLRCFVYPEDFSVLEKDLELVTSGEKSEHSLEYRWIGRDGQPIWINCRGRLIRSEDGAPSLMIGCINEIGRQQKADNISGLLGESSLREHLARISPLLSDAMLMRIGLDDFKIVNERHGMQYGNFVLHEVATLIQNHLGPDQFIYRLVSDEFMILDVSGADYLSMRLLYHEIRTLVDEIVARENYKAVYTISAGLLDLNDVDTSTEYNYDEIIKLTEFALSEAKRRGKNQLYFFQLGDYSAFLTKRYILSSLRQSLSDNFKGFELFFQPIMMTNGEFLYAAEALLRFRTPSGRKVSTFELIPILEESGLIIPVGKWIIKTALEMCKTIRQTHPDFRVSVNLSYIQILKSALFDDICAALQDADLPPSCLIVELTESGHLEDSVMVQNVWKKLKNIGVNIALDDFGTGYSNLINIGNLRPDIVKLDRSFTLKALENEYEFALLIHIIHMVHSIGLNLVVEGIETLDDLLRIAELNPDYIQGYYYSTPCPYQAFLEKYA